MMSTASRSSIYKTLVIVQARMASSRLPGKVLLDIGGQPMLAHVVERARRARCVDGVVVATTTDPQDTDIETFCQTRGYPVYRGSMLDVLDRYYQAARIFEAQAVVRLTADCPVIDPGIIDQVVGVLFGDEQVGLDAGKPASSMPAGEPSFAYDFVANRLPPPWPRTYPIGLDTEACTLQALARAWQEADRPEQREHVMPYFYEGFPANALDSASAQSRLVIDHTTMHGFRVALLNHAPDCGHFRWTVDTPQDLELLRQIFARFNGRQFFPWSEILQLFEREPALARINANVRPKMVDEVDERASR
jgi:spore coat polysaccharide biosynthesis protein SpsF